MKRKKRPPPIRTVVVVSDTHCGCKLGLCGRDIIPLDDSPEGGYKPSKYQLMLADYWDEFWQDWVPSWTKGEPFAVVVNGDMVEGVHHRATTPISHNMEDQCEIAYRVFAPIVDLCEGRFFMVRGTEAHVGTSALHEEALAKRLGAVPNEDGQRARWDLWMQLGQWEHPIHFLHHIGTTSSANYETTGLNVEFVASCNEAARWGYPPPSVVVRSHRHRHCKIELPTYYGTGIATTTPAWQLKTPYAWRSAGSRLAPPQIGGILIREGDRGLFSVAKTWTLTTSRLVVPRAR
jgi:hypothetical protein